MNTYIGIDIGKKGGVACIRDGAVSIQKIPIIDSKINHEELVNMLINLVAKASLLCHPQDGIYIAFESTSARPQEGVSSAFVFGLSSGGVLYTALALKHLVKEVADVMKIAPSKWKKHFGLIAPELSKYEKKKLSVAYCNDKYGMELKQTEDGLADAILIAQYVQDIIENGEQE